jgi:hypothetical protein
MLRVCVRNIRKTVPDVIKVFVLLFSVLLLFTILCTVLFFHLGEGDASYRDFYDGLWNNLVIITTANFPAVMVPAYNENKLYGLLFVAYIACNLYFVLSLTLATVYSHYRKHLAYAVRKQYARRPQAIQLAFRVMIHAFGDDLELVAVDRRHTADSSDSLRQIIARHASDSDAEEDDDDESLLLDNDDSVPLLHADVGLSRSAGVVLTPAGSAAGHASAPPTSVRESTRPSTEYVVPETMDSLSGRRIMADSLQAAVNSTEGHARASGKGVTAQSTTRTAIATARLSRDAFHALIHEHRPQYSSEKIDVIFRALDVTNAGSLSAAEFSFVVDVLDLRIKQQRIEMTCWEILFPRLYFSQTSRAIQRFVRSRWFERLMDAAILANIVFIVLYYNLLVDKTAADTDPHVGEAILDVWFSLLLSVGLAEVGLRLFAYGPKEFWRRKWNRFDAFLVVGTAIMFGLYQTQGASSVFVRILSVVRCLRLIRVLVSFEQSKVILASLLQLLPALSAYVTILVCVYYSYAIVGMLALAGRVQASDPLVRASDYGRAGYYSFTFDSIGAAYGTLFCIMVQNDWMTIVTGFVAVTNRAVRLFFIAFWMNTTLIVLNIVVAFIIEAFSTQWELHQESKHRRDMEERVATVGSMSSARTATLLSSATLMSSSSSEDLLYGATVSQLRRGESLTSDCGSMTRWTARRKRRMADVLRQVFSEDLQDITLAEIDGAVDEIFLRLQRRDHARVAARQAEHFVDSSSGAVGENHATDRLADAS